MRDDRRRPARAQGAGEGPEGEALGEDLARAGHQVVTDYLAKAGLQADLDALGFNLVGYGCTTCIGNSGPLPEPISEAIDKGDLVAAAVLSGNRNFEGRVNPDVRANYLASPPLVVAYALAGSMQVDLTTEPLGTDADGKPVYLTDIWPSTAGDRRVRPAATSRATSSARTTPTCSRGDEHWREIKVEGGHTYEWNRGSTYVQNPPYFEGMTQTPEPVTDIIGARILGLFVDSITTDHISPAGSIKRRRARPAPISSSTRCGRPTSTRTARAAAITR